MTSSDTRHPGVLPVIPETERQAIHGSPWMTPEAWSVPLFTVGRLRVRVHVVLIVFACMIFGKTLMAAGSFTAPIVIHTAQALLGLCIAAAIHEIGHAATTRASGGRTSEVVLWPLGGLRVSDTPLRPQAELLAALGGPLANLATCALLTPILIASLGSTSDVWLTLEPMQTFNLAIVEGQLAWWLSMLWWINATSWILLTVNLIPAYPLDGGRLAHAVLWQRSDDAWATRTAGMTAVATSMVMVLVTLLLDHTFGLALAAICAVASWHAMRLITPEEFDVADVSRPGWGQHDRVGAAAALAEPDDDVIDPTPSQTQAELPRPAGNPVSDEDTLDRLLVKINTSGIESLTMGERALLDAIRSRRIDRR